MQISNSEQDVLDVLWTESPLTVGQIVAASTLSRSAVAHHLKVLRAAGVLRNQKVGKEVWYRTEPAVVRAALQSVLDYIDVNC